MEGFGIGGDVELVVVGAGCIGEDADACEGGVRRGMDGEGGGGTNMHMAIRLSCISGTSRITSVKVPRRRTRLMKAPTWVRQLGVKDCWSCDGV